MAENINLRRIGTTQAISVSGSTASVTNPFSSQTYLIRVNADTAVNFKVFDVTAASSAATTSDTFLPANFPDYFTVSPGQKVAAIRASTDGLVTATNGTLWVTEFGS